MAVRNLLLASLATSASAVKLLVTSYAGGGAPNGTIFTLDFTPGLADGHAAASASIKTIATNSECNSAPTWLDLSLGGNKVVCLDEGFATANATILTLTMQSDGSLKTIHSAPTIQGPVSTQFYNKNSAVALAHYGGSAVSTFKVSPDGAFTPLQNFTYSNETHGPVLPDQGDSHVHEAIIDPTGQYLLFPDLGLDAVHVYSIDATTSKITAQKDIKSPAGSGPRHATFWKAHGSTFLFVTHELSNVIISYKVDYAKSGITFTKVDEISTYGNTTVSGRGRAAEIIISPDNNFVIASNRNITLKMVPNPDPSNSTQIPSNSIATFKPCADTGKLTFVQLAPSGGVYPRHFSTNKDGSMIAIANQNTFNVDVYARDIATGLIGNKIASAFGLPGGGLTNVRWVE